MRQRPSNDEVVTLLERSRRDPVWWVRTVLGNEPWAIQARVFESVRDNRRTAVRSCHAMGKSWTAAGVGLWFASSFVPSIVITTAPTFRQVQKIVWQEIRKAYYNSKIPLGGDMLLTEWKIDDGWYAFGFATDDPDAFQGIHAKNVLLILDEASGVARTIWEASDSLLSAGFARQLSIGNPTDPAGSFFDECRDVGVSRVKVSAFDTPNFTTFGITLDDVAADRWCDKLVGPLPWPTLISPEWVAEKYKRWGPQSPMFLSRVMAEFPQVSTDALIQLSLIEAAQNRELERGRPHCLSLDVARFGDDSTVCYERFGPVVRTVFKLQKHDTMDVTGRVVARLKELELGVVVRVDPIGVGAGVVDRLKELSCAVVEANVSRAPRDRERFLNARAEWFWGLRERFESGDIDIDPDDVDLAAQLSTIKYRYTSAGKIQIESKDELKSRGVMSPNEADALMLAFADVDDAGHAALEVNKAYQSTRQPERLVRTKIGGLL